MNCIFCKILNWDIPWAIFWQNEKHVALLDAFPNCYGQTLVIPKKHVDSKVFELSDHEYTELLLVAKEVANILKEKLWVQRIWMIMEWMWVNHAHIKLYPMHGLSENWTPNQDTKKMYFENYPGYLATFMGEMIDQETTKKLLQTLESTYD